MMMMIMLIPTNEKSNGPNTNDDNNANDNANANDYL